jgi:uncharacterized protein (TIGR03435 family)
MGTPGSKRGMGAHRLVGALSVVLGSLAASAQSPPAPLSFEVASIKRNASRDTDGCARIEPGSRFVAVNVSMMLIVRQAYGLPPFQISDAPEWLNTERYDIVAKAPDGVETFPNTATLLRSLLRDRFGFQAHTESRDMPTYDLVVGRSDRRLGPALQQATVDCGARTTGAAPPPGPSGEPPCGITGGPGRITVRGYSMQRVAGTLGSSLQRVVVDKTGLTGPWNLEIRFTPDQPAVLNGVVVTPSPDSPSLFTAVQEQLGLKLEPSRGPVDLLVIDRVERPTTD